MKCPGASRTCALFFVLARPDRARRACLPPPLAGNPGRKSSPLQTKNEQKGAFARSEIQLLAELQFLGDGRIPAHLVFMKVIQQTAPPGHHGQQPAAGAVILHKLLQVLCQMIDPGLSKATWTSGEPVSRSCVRNSLMVLSLASILGCPDRKMKGDLARQTSGCKGLFGADHSPESLFVIGPRLKAGCADGEKRENPSK